MVDKIRQLIEEHHAYYEVLPYYAEYLLRLPTKARQSKRAHAFKPEPGSYLASSVDPVAMAGAATDFSQRLADDLLLLEGHSLPTIVRQLPNFGRQFPRGRRSPTLGSAAQLDFQRSHSHAIRKRNCTAKSGIQSRHEPAFRRRLNMVFSLSILGGLACAGFAFSRLMARRDHQPAVQKLLSTNCTPASGRTVRSR